jgi:hypothetical protein
MVAEQETVTLNTHDGGDLDRCLRPWGLTADENVPLVDRGHSDANDERDRPMKVGTSEADRERVHDRRSLVSRASSVHRPTALLPEVLMEKMKRFGRKKRLARHEVRSPWSSSPRAHRVLVACGLGAGT